MSAKPSRWKKPAGYVLIAIGLSPVVIGVVTFVRMPWIALAIFASMVCVLGAAGGLVYLGLSLLDSAEVKR